MPESSLDMASVLYRENLKIKVMPSDFSLCHHKSLIKSSASWNFVKSTGRVTWVTDPGLQKECVSGSANLSQDDFEDLVNPKMIFTEILLVNPMIYF